MRISAFTRKISWLTLLGHNVLLASESPLAVLYLQDHGRVTARVDPHSPRRRGKKQDNADISCRDQAILRRVGT